jgi:hypothetical protein
VVALGKFLREAGVRF